MKKYNISNCIGTAEMIKGEQPWDDMKDNYLGDYVEAEDEQEAIWMCMQFLEEQIIDCFESWKEEDMYNGEDEPEYDTEINYEKNELTVYKNGEKHSIYYNFTAE